MPGLRERIISIICQEWAKGEDRETPLNAATISEQGQKAGGSAFRSRSPARAKVPRRSAPYHTLAAEPGTTTVGSVIPELCL